MFRRGVGGGRVNIQSSWPSFWRPSIPLGFDMIFWDFPNVSVFVFFFVCLGGRGGGGTCNTITVLNPKP